MSALIVAYIGVALCDMSADGAICAAHKRYFDWKGSALAAMIWPITMPFTIFAAAFLTKDCQKWTAAEIPIPDDVRKFVEDRVAKDANHDH
jgi:hypothetical protein